MRWESPIWLVGFALVILAFIWDRLRVALNQSGEKWPHIKRLWAGRNGWLEPKKGSASRSSRRYFFWIGLGLVMVALARPQWGKVEQVMFDRSRDVLIALDLSRSMLAEDVKPSRLERAKILLSSLLGDLKGERVGLLVFSGTAFLQSPLSSDYEVLQEFLPQLTPALLPQGGTDYNRMLNVAMEAFSNEAGADRFLIILSDGESRVPLEKDELKTLRDKGVKVIGLGVGTQAGGVIPDGQGGLLKDKSGAVVLSRLGVKTLKELAEVTGGTYREASGWVDIGAVIEATVNAGKVGVAQEKRQERMAERFQIFLALGVLFGLLSLWREFPVWPRLREVSSSGAMGWKRFFSKASGLSLVMLFLVFSGFAQVTNLVEGTNLPSAPLANLVKNLSEKEDLLAEDYRALAEETIGYGKKVLMQGGGEHLEEVVRDALLAVDRGEKVDVKGADWPRLRKELEDLLKQQQQQQNQKNQQDQQNQQDQKDQKDQNNSQQNNQSDSDKSQNPQNSSQKENQSDSEKKEDSQKEKKSQSQKGKEEKDHKQKVGGEKKKEMQPMDAQTMEAKQKLDQVRQKDSPARLFQLMEGKETNSVFNQEEEW
ncbi:MAG: VWA domain-containing protein [Verrucomicrobiae bacterium]|nr:VWA domain-containing protein [Verrucomicrobiae bacterium]